VEDLIVSDDPERFSEFWKQLENTVDDGLKDKLVRPSLQEHLVEVWEKDTRSPLQKVRNELYKNWEGLRPSLESVALTGRRLDVKLGEFFEARKRWGAKRDRRTFRAVLGWAKVILGSLVQALQSVPGLRELVEIVKEFIETFDQAVADTGEG